MQVKKLIFLLILSTINLQAMEVTGLFLRRRPPKQPQEACTEMTVYSSLPEQKVAQPEVASTEDTFGNLTAYLGLPNDVQITILQKYLEGKKGQQLIPKEIQTVGVHISLLRRILSAADYHNNVNNISVIDGNRAAASSLNDTTFWNISTNKYLGKIKSTLLIKIISPTKIAMITKFAIHINNKKNGAHLKTLKTPYNIKSVAVISPNKIAASTYNQIYIWDIDTGQCLHTISGENRYSFESITAISPDKLISSGYNAYVKIWNVNTGECLHTLNEIGYVRHVAVVSPTKIAAATDHKIYICDIDTGECLQELEGDRHSFRSVASISPSKIVTNTYGDNSTNGHTVKVWDVNSGECLHTFSSDNIHDIEQVAVVSQNEIALLYNRKTLFDSNNVELNDYIKIFNVKTSECLNTLINTDDHKISCMTVVSPDKIVFCSTRTIKTWSFRSKSEKIKRAIKDTFDINNPLALLMATQGRPIPKEDKAEIQAQLVESDGSVENWLKTVDEQFRSMAERALC
jgi:WD40 repeat protein